MLKLLPQQVTDYWSEISEAIILANPATSFMTHERMNNVLTSLLMEESQCWVLCEDYNPEDPKIYGVCVTTVTTDHVAEVNNLMIYSLYSKKLLTGKMYLSLFFTLSKFAKAHKCARVVAYTDVPKIIEVVDRLPNGHTNYTFIEWDVHVPIKPKDLRDIISNIDNEMNKGHTEYNEDRFKETLINEGGYKNEDL